MNDADYSELGEQIYDDPPETCCESPFRIGDVVTLRGGFRQPLNVINVNSKYPVALVGWFTNNGAFCEEILPTACLDAYNLVIDNPYTSLGSE